MNPERKESLVCILKQGVGIWQSGGESTVIELRLYLEILEPKSQRNTGFKYKGGCIIPEKIFYTAVGLCVQQSVSMAIVANVKKISH